MAYIRWSDESDVYCYLHVGNFYAIHVGNNHPIPGTEINHEKLFTMTEEEFDQELHRCLKPIGLPYDGQTFEESTIEKARDRLLFLKGVGYLVPDIAIKRLEDEMNENKRTND